MENHILPKNLIKVPSKRRPDKVYYCNIKTEQSTLSRPISDEVEKTSQHINKRHMSYHKRKEIKKAETLGYEFVEDEADRQQQSSEREISRMTEKMVKEKDTPQMKAIREKIHQSKLRKSNVNNKTSNTEHKWLSLSSRSSSKLKDDTASISLKDSSFKSTENGSTTSPFDSGTETNKQTSNFDQNDDENTTFTPQMRAIYEKMSQKRFIISSNSGKKTNIQIGQDKCTASTKSKQDHEFIGQINKTQRKQKDIRKDSKHSSNRSLFGLRKPPLRKNLAKDRMQRLKTELMREEISLIFEKPLEGKFKYRSSISTKQNSELLNTSKNAEISSKYNKLSNNTLQKNNHTVNNNLQIQQDDLHTDNIIDKLKQDNKEISYEEMDWEPIKDEEVTSEVQIIRTQLNKKNCTYITDCILKKTVELTAPLEPENKNPLYIIIDTNIFLSHLEYVEEIRDTKLKSYLRPFIVIPWTVIRELDYLKTASKPEYLRVKARKAISFLNEQFSSKHPRIVGQTLEEALKIKGTFSPESPDDEILQCCLQTRKLRRNVILLSNDKNLCTKAMMCNIMAFGRYDPLDSLNDEIISDDSVECSISDEEFLLLENIYEDTKTVMKDFISEVISKQLADIYGSEWQRYVFIKPPWTIVTVLKCAIKHWIAAISESFQKRSDLCILKYLLEVFEFSPANRKKLQKMERILEQCYILIEATNTDKHHNIIIQSRNIITEFREKYHKYMKLKELLNKIEIVEDIEEQERRANKTLNSFDKIYNHLRNVCGSVATNKGITCSFNFNLMDPFKLDKELNMQPEISKHVADLVKSLNKLLEQTESSTIEYQTLFNLHRDLNTLLPDTETTFDLDLSDIYYCAQRKKHILGYGLNQLKELVTYFCALDIHA